MESYSSVKDGAGSMSSGGVCQYRPLTIDEENIAVKALIRYSERYPEVYKQSSDYLKSQLNENFFYHVRYMRESLATNDPAIFLDYISWVKVRLDSLNIPRVTLERSLGAFNDVLLRELPKEAGERASAYIAKANDSLTHPPLDIPTYIRDDNPLANDARAYLAAVISPNREDARLLLMGLLDRNVSVRDIYRYIFQPVLQETGRLWQTHQLSIAQEHYITAATQLFMSLLYDRMMEEKRKQKRKNRYIITTCVSDEHHDIGIRMVADFFEMDGWDTLYTGANTPSQSLIKMIQAHRADAIAISCTIAFHIPWAFELIQEIRAEPTLSGTRILVGGYLFNLKPDLWQCIGADAGASTADEAVEKVNRLISR
jgi:methanogenic corrinoid protein MtbC1